MSLSKIKLLYVEDEDIIIEQMNDILEDEVQDLYIAKNGKEGLEFFHKYSPDMILTDVNMPIMDGLEMSEAIKILNKDIPIVLLTAFNDIELFTKSIDIGIDKYIHKPIKDINKLFDTLNDVAKQVEEKKDYEHQKQMLITQNKIASIGEMLGNIAHQWRQPLSVITTTASSVKFNIEFGIDMDNDQLINYADRILKQSNYLSKVIDDFRDFFDNEKVITQSYNLKNSIEKITTLLDETFKNEMIIFSSNIEDIEIVGNENILIQAILNIINNSKDAIIQNNLPKELRTIEINSKKIDNNLSITISDMAGGIKDDIIEKIFEPYFTTKHQSIGTGIGLYMTHKIITQHLVGEVKVYNKSKTISGISQKGAVFDITIPLS